VKRFSLELPGYETAEVQKVGGVVRLEFHTDATTIILDFDRPDARAIADALHAACHRDLWQSPEPPRYCGGDHCSHLWNLPCDDPRHRDPSLPTRAEGA
jgi:hypothetical protein